MNLATEQTEIIRALLTYPDRAAKILVVHSHLIDCELVKRIEQSSYRMRTNGSQQAATFLASLIPRLNQIIDIVRVIDAIDLNSCEPEEMETFILSGTAVESDKNQPPAIYTYRHLIDVLTASPQETVKLLVTHQNLIDRNSIEMIKKLAIFMAANGSQDIAALLCDSIVQLTSQVSSSEVVELE